MFWVRSLLGIVCLASGFGLPARAAPPIEAYGKLPAIEYVRLSPSGARYAFIGTDGERRRLYISTVDNKPVAMVEVGSVKVRDLWWAGDDRVLVRISATAALTKEEDGRREEMESLASYNVVTNHLTNVFGPDNPLKLANQTIGIYGISQENGHWYGYVGGLKVKGSGRFKFFEPGNASLYRVDLDNNDITLVANADKDPGNWLVGPLGGIAASRLWNEQRREWRIFAGGVELAKGKSEFTGLKPFHFGRTPDTVLFDAPEEGPDAAPGTYGYREIPLTPGGKTVSPDTSNLAAPIIDPNTRLWIGNVLENDTREEVFFAPAVQARWRGAQKAFPHDIAHIESWSADFDKMIVFTDGGNDSGTHWLVDIPHGTADPLGGAYPSIKPADVGRIRMFDWQASDGLALHGILTLPPGREARALPLVVLPHGGPESRDYLSFDWMAQAVASRGYVVFQPNFRGSSGYGLQFRNAGFNQWGRKMQTDISDGVAALAREGLVDPKRACIFGASYGGYAALAGVTLQHGFYRCAVSVAGIADFQEFLGRYSNIVLHPSSALRFYRSYLGDNSEFGSTLLDDISPASQADHADAPILLIHGKDDSVVPFKQSEAMERALKRAGKPVEFIKMEKEDHWLSHEETRVTMLKEAVAFIEKYNPPN